MTDRSLICVCVNSLKGFTLQIIREHIYIYIEQTVTACPGIHLLHFQALF